MTSDSTVPLLCFHHAGGSAGAFRPWAPHVPAGVELVPVSLPSTKGLSGRREHRETTSLVRHLRSEFDDLLGRRHALFGHSMGGLLAYLLACSRVEDGLRAPEALTIAATVAPHCGSLGFDVDAMDDRSLIDVLARIGGVPETLLKRPEWLAPMLPTVRDDLRLCQHHRHRPGPELSGVPVTIIGAVEDKLVSRDRLTAWADLLPGARMMFLPGGHFFGGESAPQLRAVALGSAAAARGRVVKA